VIEKLLIRHVYARNHIYSLLLTFGLGFILQDACRFIWGPSPLPLNIPESMSAAVTPDLFFITWYRVFMVTVVIVAVAGLFAFLRFTRLGFAVRATAQDREAAQQMGVDVDTVNSAVFAIASALGGLSGLLVGMYYNHIDPGMSFQATLKGIVAVVIGGVGNVPGAIVGSLMLGLIESYGIALFGTTYRNLFAFVLLIGFLLWLPNGLFGGRATASPALIVEGLLLHPRAQPQHGLGVHLRDARLGHAEHLADLAQRQLLVVVEGHDELLALGEARDRLGERLAHLGLVECFRGLDALGILEHVEQ